MVLGHDLRRTKDGTRRDFGVVSGTTLERVMSLFTFDFHVSFNYEVSNSELATLYFKIPIYERI